MQDFYAFFGKNALLIKNVSRFRVTLSTDLKAHDIIWHCMQKLYGFNETNLLFIHAFFLLLFQNKFLIRLKLLLKRHHVSTRIASREVASW